MILKKNKMKKKYLFIIPLILFILDYILIELGYMYKIDWNIYYTVQLLNSNIMTNFFKVCSFLGGTYFYITLVIILMIIKNKKEIWIGIHLLVIQGINRIIKYLVKRPRPPKVLHLVNESNYSFPSGHSMSAMIGYGLLIVEVANSNFKYKKFFIFILGLMIFLIGLSRIYLGVHYFSDVIGGFLLSLSYLLFIYYNTSLYA